MIRSVLITVTVLLACIGTCGPAYGQAEDLQMPAGFGYQVQGWEECGIALGMKAGLARHDAERTTAELAAWSVSHSDDFLRKLMALAYVESRMQWNRTSRTGAVGILQITRGAAESVLRSGVPLVVGYSTSKPPTLQKLAQPEWNVKFGSAYLWLAIRDSRGDWTQALAIYNGGYRQQLNILRNKHVIDETAQYILQVQHLSYTCGID